MTPPSAALIRPSRGAWFAALLLSQAAWAADPYGYGRGTANRVVGSLGVSLSRSAALLSSAAPGTAGVALPSGFTAPGELLMVHQTFVERDGGLSSLALAQTPAGTYAFRRVVAVAGDAVTLDAPLDTAFEAPGAQAVVVAELSSLTIEADGGLAPTPWDGVTGGILAVFVDGALRNDGVVDATARGYRGGLGEPVPAPPGSCALLDVPIGQPYARKGEGFARSSAGLVAGMGNATSGGGGANCRDSGGGGGGHIGAGGLGGWTAAATAFGGLGGIASSYDPLQRLLFGGGGGAGGAGVMGSTNGGAGGGIIYIRARSITGSGRYLSNGDVGSFGQDRGAAGGGAGGAVVLRAEAPVSCADMRAEGAAGGDGRNGACTQPTKGPGGGGAGGLLVRQPGAATCPGFVGGAANGLWLDNCAAARAHGAGPANHGSIIELTDPYVAPPDAGAPDAGPVDAGPFALTSPKAGEVFFVRRPPVAGEAAPGATVTLSLDGAPPKSLMASASGLFSTAWDIDLSDGSHSLEASSGARQVRVDFVVDAAPASPPRVLVPAHNSYLPSSPLVVAGTGLKGTLVHVLVDDEERATASVSDDGHWLTDAALELAAGSHTVRAWAVGRNELPSESSPTVRFTIAPRLNEEPAPQMCVGCGAADPSSQTWLIALLAVLRHRWARRGALLQRRQPASA